MGVKNNYTVRNMTPEEVESIAIAWAAKEGWNPGLHDSPVFYATDPNGFFVGIIDNEPVACISAVAYSPDFGFIGFYIVKPEYRKEGYSIKLLSAAHKHLSTQNIGLDGVVEQQANYMKIGFKIAYNNIRFEGTTRKSDAIFEEIIPASSLKFDLIAAYDANLFPAPRAHFLKKWLTLPESIAFASVENGELNGYGVIRKCLRGYKIGPLFANSKEIALRLITVMIDSVEENEPFYLDVPDANKEAIELTVKFKMKKVFETARMYSKAFPRVDINKIYGITSFELG